MTVRKDIAWTGVLWKVDGTQATQASFEAAINEGDTIDITGTGASSTYALVNKSVEGVAGSVASDPNPVLPTTDFTIGALGDDPANNTNDATYEANGGPTDTDTFKVDGQASDYATFSGDLTAGDVVTYTRAASVEAYALVNRAPTLVKGQATETSTRPPVRSRRRSPAGRSPSSPSMVPSIARTAPRARSS